MVVLMEQKIPDFSLSFTNLFKKKIHFSKWHEITLNKKFKIYKRSVHK